MSCLPLARSLTKISGPLLSVPSTAATSLQPWLRLPVIQPRPRTEIERRGRRRFAAAWRVGGGVVVNVPDTQQQPGEKGPDLGLIGGVFLQTDRSTLTFLTYNSRRQRLVKAEAVIITQQLHKQDNGALLRRNEPFCSGLVGVIGSCSHTAAAVMGNKIKHVPQLSERRKHEQSDGCKPEDSRSGGKITGHQTKLRQAGGSSFAGAPQASLSLTFLGCLLAGDDHHLDHGEEQAHGHPAARRGPHVCEPAPVEERPPRRSFSIQRQKSQNP